MLFKGRKIEIMDNLDNETKRCPFCNEEINAKAIKCKHCLSMLVEGASPLNSIPVNIPPIQQPAPVGGATKAFMYMLTALIPIVGLIAGFIYRVKPNPETKRFGNKLLIFSLVMLVVSSFLFVFAVKAAINYYRNMSSMLNNFNVFQ